MRNRGMRNRCVPWNDCVPRNRCVPWNDCVPRNRCVPRNDCVLRNGFGAQRYRAADTRATSKQTSSLKESCEECYRGGVMEVSSALNAHSRAAS